MFLQHNTNAQIHPHRLFVSGVVYGVLFAITKNLIVLIPITWAVGSTIGTIEGGFSFDWDTVGIYASLLVLQLLILIWINTRAKKDSINLV